MTAPRPGKGRPIKRGSTPPPPRPATPRPGAAPVRAQRPKAGPAARPASASPNRTPLIAAGVVAAIALVALLLVTNGFGLLGGGATPAPSGGGSASGCPTRQPAALASGETRTVTVQTSLGTFKIKVEGSLSPIAAGNFVALASCGFYDGVVFHRVATLQDGTPFVIQGGDPSGQGTGGPGYTIKDEPVTATYKRGTVAMARTSQPDSQGSQFFIVLDDKDASVLAQANTYAIFGEVVEGMDVVDAIYKAANGVELPPNPIHMNKVTVSNP